METLAIHGGPSVRAGRPWPSWPRYDGVTEAALVQTLRDHRWTVSWPGTGAKARERQFAERFAEYHGTSHAIAVDHGSTALALALELLDIGPGDEVIVPAVTWVASATAVLRVGALPVLADVEADTGCLDPAKVAGVLSSRTKAIMCVHLACTVADLARLLELANHAGIALIEDVAQAHGAIWNGRRVGTWGQLGAFSFQSGKVLAAGEGGAVLLHGPDQWRRAQQLRSDARTYAEPRPGLMELAETGEVIGANRTMSEFNAAILLDRLDHLDAENVHREQQARRLEEALADLPPGLATVNSPQGTERRSIYEYAIRCCPQAFADADLESVASAMTAELGTPWYLPDPPLFRSVLFRPATLKRYSNLWDHDGRWRSLGRSFPGAEGYVRNTLLFHHSVLLGEDEDIADITGAIEKVRRAARAGDLR